jgi:hypothetical protein
MLFTWWSFKLKTLKLIAIITVALAGFGSPAKAHLIDARPLTSFFPGEDLSDPVAEAAALDRQFDTGPLTFLGRYLHDPTTGAVTFVPGAISNPSQLNFTPTGLFTGLLSWNLTGTGFQNRFVVTLVSGDDFAFDVAARVTRDEFVNSRGPQPFGGTPSDFFGSSSNVPEAASTGLLLASTLAGLEVMRRFAHAHSRPLG